MSKIVPAAGVLSDCVDPRFHRVTVKYVRRLVGGHNIVPRSRPGGTKRHCLNCAVTRELIQDIAEINIPHHGVLNLFNVNHADCLAWGGSKSFSSMEEERAAHVLDMMTGKKLFEEEILAHAEMYFKYGDITLHERLNLERALNGGFKVVNLFVSPLVPLPPGRTFFTDDEVNFEILED